MARSSSVFTDSKKGKSKKRTRQGMGRGTKWGTKPSGRSSKKARDRYKKKYRGQGGPRKRCKVPKK